ncbi:MAG: hypothetical protein IKH82_01415 [Clostridiales bacterium]|nr:hypothetical protein [Clostridiales bacterium]
MKRFIAVLVCALMLGSLIPAGVLADGELPEPSVHPSTYLLQSKRSFWKRN